MSEKKKPEVLDEINVDAIVNTYGEMLGILNPDSDDSRETSGSGTSNRRSASFKGIYARRMRNNRTK